MQKALENTIATFTAYDEDKAVGMARLIVKTFGDTVAVTIRERA